MHSTVGNAYIFEPTAITQNRELSYDLDQGRKSSFDNDAGTNNMGTLTKSNRIASKEPPGSTTARQAQQEALHYRVRGCERISNATVMTITMIVVASAILTLVLSLAVSNGDGFMPPMDQGALYHGHTGTGG